MAEDDPKKTSSDYDAMLPYWSMVDAILGGAEAMRGRPSGYSLAGPASPVSNLDQLNRSGRVVNASPYLPQFPNETATDYECRRQHAPFTNIYSDISRNLASKPFRKTLELSEEAPDELKPLEENIDGQGNHQHVVAREVFKDGIDYGITWILVDYAKAKAGATLADERAIGARPYWVRIQAQRLISVYSDFINGVETIVHARIYEPSTQRAGYGEVSVERVRVLNRDPIMDTDGNILGYTPATWVLWEEVEGKDDQGNTIKAWVQKDGGPITIGIIPLVPFITGKRQGSTWKVEPPLKDIAYNQVEEFQQESNLKTIKELTAFPMLAGNGVSPQMENGAAVIVPVGPRAVLFAPPNSDGSNGEWKFIETTAASLTFLKADLEGIRTEMRDLGMMPLTTANLTVITTANVSMKAHSQVQAWALGLKDCLEQCWKITCMWLGQDIEPEVNVHTDFGVDFEAGTELDALLKAEAAGILSKRTTQDEFKRRGVLSDDFDADEEEQLLAEQQQGLEPEMAIDPVTGQPIAPAPANNNVVPINRGSAVNGFSARMKRG